MKKIKIISWNVNGIRASLKKGFLEWLDKESPDILCIQETKAHRTQLDASITDHAKYHSFWHSPSIKKGYSGVATFSKIPPLHYEVGFGIEKFDCEGRVIVTEFDHFVLLNVYFPNGQRDEERLNYKLEFYNDFLDFIVHLKRKHKKVIFCGDVNTAHKEIDLSRPKENEKVSGFLPIEREWIDKVLEHGFFDSLRHFHKEGGLYTWWSMRTRARDRNVGWRIDYFFLQNEFKDNIVDAYTMPDVMGSDHCPIAIELKF